jgi:hypothetical protein
MRFRKAGGGEGAVGGFVIKPTLLNHPRGLPRAWGLISKSEVVGFAWDGSRKAWDPPQSKGYLLNMQSDPPLPVAYLRPDLPLSLPSHIKRLLFHLHFYNLI